MKESKFYQEVMAEGALERARADVLDAIEVRFGAKAAAEFKEALPGITDLKQLSQLLRLAIQSRRLAEFQRAFASTSSTPYYPGTNVPHKPEAPAKGRP